VGEVDGLPAGARAQVITVSDRSHGGLRHDASGPLLASLLAELGFVVADVVVVPDEAPAIAAAVLAAVASADLVVTTGGTGLAPRDVTPDAVGPLLERTVPGIVEALRLHHRDLVPTTILSRAVAGTIGSSLVVTLPGSPNGVRDGVAVLAPVVGHAVAQLRGGDH
jgi:molybdenum cofactor synthesis domain-containing protein